MSRAVFVKRLLAAALAVCLVFLTPPAAAARTFDAVSWGSRVMGFEAVKRAAGEYEPLRRPLLVAVLDSGCDASLAVFEGRVSPDSYNFMDNSADISDESGHGTSVAGVLADALPQNVSLLILKICGADGRFATDAQIKSAMEYALDKGVDAVNMSIAITTGTPIRDMRESWVWDECLERFHERGIPFVTGLANAPIDSACVYPACSPWTFAVSGIARDGTNMPGSAAGTLTDFCAPAVGVECYRAGGRGETLLTGGNSVASPYVCAAATLVKLLRPSYDVEQTRAALASCAIDLGVKGRDYEFGDGMPVISRWVSRLEEGFVLEEAVPLALRGGVAVLLATDGFPGESAVKLFDDDPSSKWCLPFDGEAFVEWRVPRPLSVLSVSLTTGNDNSVYPGRNPRAAELFARNTEDEPWTRIWTLTDEMADANYLTYETALCAVTVGTDQGGNKLEETSIPDTAQKYCLFRFTVTQTTGSDVLQLSELKLGIAGS